MMYKLCWISVWNRSSFVNCIGYLNKRDHSCHSLMALLFFFFFFCSCSTLYVYSTDLKLAVGSLQFCVPKQLSIPKDFVIMIFILLYAWWFAYPNFRSMLKAQSSSSMPSRAWPLYSWYGCIRDAEYCCTWFCRGAIVWPFSFTCLPSAYATFN